MPPSPTPIDDRLAAAYALIRDCQSDDGWCGEMPWDLRDRVDDFVEALDRGEQPASREREALDALLSLVVKNAQPSLGGVYPSMGPEHRMWVRWARWTAGAETADEAREALKDVIRAGLIEQAGGADAAS